MSLKIGSNSIGDVYVGNNKISKIYVGSDLVYSAITDDLRFNYIGIDANGNSEMSNSYDGTPVAYGLGQLNYYYRQYTLVSPTPTTASGYSGKYVYDTSTDKYTQCSYSSSTLTPSWVEVGVTPCYTGADAGHYPTPQPETDTFRLYTKSTPNLSAFNKAYWGNDIDKAYTSKSEVPIIPELETLVLPDTYLGKPVINVQLQQFMGRVSRVSTSAAITWYAPCRITNLVLGKNMESLAGNCFAGTCSTADGGIGTFTFNTKLKGIYAGALWGVFSSENVQGSVVLPSSVTYLVGTAFGQVGEISADHRYLYRLTISSPTIECTDVGSSCIADYCNYVVFENTVVNVSGALRGSSSGTNGAIVFKHSQNQSITLSINKNKSAIACTIYTDCDAVKNYDWASKNYTVTFKSLSEYTGG